MHPLTERTVFPASPWRANTASQSGGGVYSCYGAVGSGIGNTLFYNNSAPAYPDLYVPSTVHIGHCFTNQNLSGLGSGNSGTQTGSPGFVSSSFNGSNFHEFLHLSEEDANSDDIVDSVCVDRGDTYNDGSTPNRYRDIDDSVAPRDSHPGDSLGIEDLHIDPGIDEERDIGADEAPTPALADFDFWFEQR